MLTIREIVAADHIDSVQDMLAANWSETGFDFELRPAVDLIAQLQDMGLLFVLGAFVGTRMVGYSSAMVAPHTYNPDVICCNSDALFVLPGWRNTSVGARLIAETEKVASARGATRMLWHTRAGTPLAAAMKKRGYLPADEIVMKRI